MFTSGMQESSGTSTLIRNPRVFCSLSYTLFGRGTSSSNDFRRFQLVTASWDIALEEPVQGLETRIIMRKVSLNRTEFHASRQTGIHVNMQITKQQLLSHKHYVLKVKITSNSGKLSCKLYLYYSLILKFKYYRSKDDFPS